MEPFIDRLKQFGKMDHKKELSRGAAETMLERSDDYSKSVVL